MGRFLNRPCEKCNNFFEPRSSNDRWCKSCRTKTCDNCNNEFVVSNPSKFETQKFCSKDCQLKGRYNDFKIKCQKCGITFISNSASSKLCDKCKTFKCITCGKDFIISKIRNSETIKYCSRDCQIKGREIKVKHTCVKCGIDFISKSANSKWCDKCCTVTCLICGKHYVVKPRRFKLSKYCSKACRAKGDMNHIWTDDDFAFIKENYPYKMSLKQIADNFNTSASAIARLKSKLELDDCPIEIRQRRVGDTQMIWTKSRIIDKINEVFELGEPITSSDFQKKYGSIHVAACNRFGSWEKAIEAAGFKYNDINLYSDRVSWTKDLIISQIKNLFDSGVDLMASNVRDNYTALFVAARREKDFGTWESAIESAGIDYQKVCGERWGQIYFGKDGHKYTSIIEGKVADYLFDFLEENKIKDYYTQVRVTNDRRWTCDFVVQLFDNIPDTIWIEVDGLQESRKEGAYTDYNEKIKYYCDHNYYYRIIIKPNDIKDLIEKETTPNKQ